MNEFRASRAGARNVAGVAFQAYATASILLLGVGGRPVLSVVPEGEEDIDLLVGPGEVPLYVQAKFRSDPITRRDLAQALVKAWLAANIEPNGCEATIRSVAIVSNVSSFAGLGPTGWDRYASPHQADGSESARAQLITEIRKLLIAQDRSDLAETILSRSHLVQIDTEANAMARAVLFRRPKFTELQAHLVWSRLVSTVMQSATDNRQRGISDAQSVTAQQVEQLLDEGAMAAGAWLDKIESERILVATDFQSKPPENRDVYLRGVRCTAQHVGAGYPIPRPNQESTVSAAVTGGSGAMLVGQSGGGKSTLMWQVAAGMTIFNCYTLTRVHSRDVAGLLKLLQSLAPSLSTPILLCVDDLNELSFPAWPELMNGIRVNANIRVLATCREDYFNPSLLAGTLTAIRPQFEEDDAFVLAQELRSNDAALTPAECAQLYRDSRGLMLEFVHMAVTSRRISETLEAQAYELGRIADQLPARISRIVLTADLCGMSVSIDQLRQYATSDLHLRNALAQLIREHVIVSSDGLVRGLHQVRSAHLVSALHTTYPRIASTIMDLIAMAPEHELPSLARLWVSRNAGDIAELAESVGARFSLASNRDWDEISHVCLQIEAIDFMPQFEEALPDDEQQSGPALLMAVADGRRRLFDGSLRDLAKVSLSSSLIPHRVRRLRELGEVFDTLPLPHPFRRVVVAHLRATVPLETERLTVTALAMLRGSDCFSVAELQPFVERCRRAASDIDPHLQYAPWRTRTAQLRLSRAWSAKATAEIARLGSNGLTAIRGAIGKAGCTRALWVLQLNMYVVGIEGSDNFASVSLIVPQAMLEGANMTSHVSSALEDAAAASELTSISATLLCPNGAPFVPRGDSSNASVVSGEEESPSILGLTFLGEFQQSNQASSWFDWIDALGKALPKIVSVVEDAISLVMSCRASGGRWTPQAKTLYATVHRTRLGLATSFPEPPDLQLHEFLPGDLLATWAFGSATTRAIGWKPKPVSELAGGLISHAVQELLSQLERVIDYYCLDGQATVDVNQWMALNETSRVLQIWLPRACDFMLGFEGTKASESMQRLRECHQAIQIICSTDTSLVQFSSDRLMGRVAVSRSHPSRAVDRIVAQLAKSTAMQIADEHEAVKRLAEVLGGGWAVFPIPSGGQLWDSVAPRWVFVGPPSSIVGMGNAMKDFEACLWLQNRCIVAFRRLDGSFKLMARMTSDDWLSMSDSETMIVQSQLESNSERFVDPDNKDQLDWPPLAEFLLMIDVLSREKSAATKSSTYIQAAFDLQEIEELASKAPMETSILIEHLRRELDDVKTEETIAQRLSDPMTPSDDPLVQLVLNCQNLLANEAHIFFEEKGDVLR
jgi:hypothetical protein